MMRFAPRLLPLVLAAATLGGCAMGSLMGDDAPTRTAAPRPQANGVANDLDGNLRQALDSALSSPSGLGVAVDEDGKLLGGVRADDVLEALKEQRRVPELG